MEGTPSRSVWEDEESDREVWRPNREKASSKTTKLLVAVVLLIAAGLLGVVTVGGWERMQSSGAAIVAIGWGVFYVLFALLVLRWNRGILPVAAAFAVLMGIFAGVAAPSWFSRSKPGLDSPALPEDLLGLLVVIIVAVQVVIVVVTMIAFRQEWQVEEEKPSSDRDRRDRLGGEPATA